MNWDVRPAARSFRPLMLARFWGRQFRGGWALWAVTLALLALVSRVSSLTVESPGAAGVAPLAGAAIAGPGPDAYFILSLSCCRRGHARRRPLRGEDRDGLVLGFDRAVELLCGFRPARRGSLPHASPGTAGSFATSLSEDFLAISITRPRALAARAIGVPFGLRCQRHSAAVIFSRLIPSGKLIPTRNTAST